MKRHNESGVGTELVTNSCLVHLINKVVHVSSNITCEIIDSDFARDGYGNGIRSPRRQKRNAFYLPQLILDLQLKVWLITEQHIALDSRDQIVNILRFDLVLEKEINELMEDKQRVIRFSKKVREIDRQYEFNNNGQLDNGVYHKNIA